MPNHEDPKGSASPWTADIGCGGFLAVLALVMVALLPAFVLVSPGLFWLLLTGAPVVAALGLVWSLGALLRGKRMAWLGVGLALVAGLAWWIVREFFGVDR